MGSGHAQLLVVVDVVLEHLRAAAAAVVVAPGFLQIPLAFDHLSPAPVVQQIVVVEHLVA